MRMGQWQNFAKKYVSYFYLKASIFFISFIFSLYCLC
jgi:hypothetical protein